MPQNEILPVDVIALIEDQENTNPIVMLRDAQTNNVLPIWIGDSEARSIAMALNNVRPARPLTHHLLIGVVLSMQGVISRVVIDRLQSDTYYASLFVVVAGKQYQVDARPSDALVIAIEAKAPIFVAKQIMEVAGHPNPFSLSELAKETREKRTLQQINPDEAKKIQQMMESARAREQKSSGL